MGAVLLVALVLLVLGALPAWPYSRALGVAPAFSLGVALLIVVILLVIGLI